MSSIFKSALLKEIYESLPNNFGIENFDEHRFGKMPEIGSPKLFDSTKKRIKKIIGYDTVQLKRVFEVFVKRVENELKEYEEGLENLYQNVNDENKDLIIKIIAYRLMGFSKVKLPFNNPAYWKSLEQVKNLKEGGVTYDPHFMHFILEKFNLNPIGYDIKLFFSEVGIAIDFIAEQYAYKNRDRTIVQAENGDIVLDVGGCWGDTALYFAHKVGSDGKVYSFEFIPDNIKLHNINTDFNPHLKKNIELVPHPISDKSGSYIYFTDNGPGSKIQQEPFEGHSGSTTTLSIDDFVVKYNIEKIDFIKMDIEGTEPFALKGAINTIKKFKPKLAIAIYHSLNDFVNIPKWITDLNLGYELYVGHYTIQAEETICFAKPKEK